jgi:ketosteroid isomerase-like protein
MTHPNETMLREAYAQFGRGDLEGYWSHCTDDFTFHVAGKSNAAGDFQGKERFFAMIGNVMGLTGGQFEETVEDAFADDDHGVVLVHHRFPRGGVEREYRSAHVYDIKDGKLAECWEQPRNQFVFDEAWG